MADEANELKDQRVVTMMSDSELKAIDDWMFANRIRSRGEAIRRLCRIGVAADEHFNAMVDGYMGFMSFAMQIADHEDEDRALDVLRRVVGFGQSFGKLRAAIVTMRNVEKIEAAFADLEEVMAAYADQGPERSLALLRALRKFSDAEETEDGADTQAKVTIEGGRDSDL